MCPCAHVPILPGRDGTGRAHGDPVDLRALGMSERRGWIDRLATRWNVSPSRVLIILLVFACTGFTVMFLKRPVVAWFTGGEQRAVFTVLYYLLILPVYNVLLLAYGALFGQFRFFWAFEKRFFGRLFGRRTR